MWGVSHIDAFQSERTNIQLGRLDEIMGTGTVRLHRVLKTTPETVYKAFLDAEAMV